MISYIKVIKKSIILITCIIFLSSCQQKKYKIGMQDGKKIIWTKIAEDKKSVLLFADDILNAREYDSRRNVKVEFATSSINEYLNSDFINTYFSKEEINRLIFINEYDDLMVTLITLDELRKISSEDIVFVKDDYYDNENYFKSNKSIIAKATKDALYNDIEVFDNELHAEIMNQKVVDNRYDFANGYSPYWLLDVNDENMPLTVTATGYVEGRDADSLYIGIRPIIRIKK